MKILLRSILAIFLIGLYTFLMPVYAEKNGLEVNPAFSDITINQSESEKQIVIQYSNNSDKAIDLNLSFYNYNQKNRTGETQIFSKELSKATSLIPYLRIEPSTFTLSPRDKKEVRLTVKNDEALSPGGHYAAVVAEAKYKIDSLSSNSVVAPSITSLLLLRKIGGEKYGLGFNEFTPALKTLNISYPEDLNLLFTNAGNVHLVLYGTVEERDMFDRLLYKGVINTSSVFLFPDKQRFIAVNLHKVNNSLPISLNKIIIKGNDSLHKVTFNYHKDFAYVNIVSTIVSVLALIIIVFLFRKILIQVIRAFKKVKIKSKKKK